MELSKNSVCEGLVARGEMLSNKDENRRDREIANGLSVSSSRNSVNGVTYENRT